MKIFVTKAMTLQKSCRHVQIVLPYPRAGKKEAAIREQNDVLLERSRILNDPGQAGGGGALAGFNPVLSKFFHLVGGVHLIVCHL